MFAFGFLFIISSAFFRLTQAWHHVVNQEALERSLAENDVYLIACESALALTCSNSALTSYLFSSSRRCMYMCPIFRRGNRLLSPSLSSC